jgi:hypothetical protein
MTVRVSVPFVSVIHQLAEENKDNCIRVRSFGPLFLGNRPSRFLKSWTNPVRLES